MADPYQTRAFYSRRRRRTLQNQKDFEIAGYSPASLFAFGATIAGGSSANTMTLPADIEITVSLAAATAAGDIGIEDVTAGTTYVQAEPAPSGGAIRIRKVFREGHQIKIARGALAPAGTVAVFFSGPKTQLFKIGEAIFS